MRTSTLRSALALGSLSLTVAATGATALAGGSDEFWAAHFILPSTLFRVEWTSGTANPIAILLNIEPMDLALAPDGTLYACEVDRLYTVDTQTGATTLVNSIQT